MLSLTSLLDSADFAVPVDIDELGVAVSTVEVVLKGERQAEEGY